jgi:hypothetical protein
MMTEDRQHGQHIIIRGNMVNPFTAVGEFGRPNLGKFGHPRLNVCFPHGNLAVWGIGHQEFGSERVNHLD